MSKQSEPESVGDILRRAQPETMRAVRIVRMEPDGLDATRDSARQWCEVCGERGDRASSMCPDAATTDARHRWSQWPRGDR